MPAETAFPKITSHTSFLLILFRCTNSFITAAVSSHIVRDGRSFQISGIILTGDLKPNPEIIELLKKSHMPVLLTKEDTYRVAANIENLICKIQITDKDKIEEATRLVKMYVDTDFIINSFKRP